LVTKAALLLGLIVVASFFRALVGPGGRRGDFMLAGTLGGLFSGVAVAYFISRWTTTDVSAISACFGVMIGWAVAWRFARDVAREAH